MFYWEKKRKGIVLHIIPLKIAFPSSTFRMRNRGKVLTFIDPPEFFTFPPKLYNFIAIISICA